MLSKGTPFDNIMNDKGEGMTMKNRKRKIKKSMLVFVMGMSVLLSACGEEDRSKAEKEETEEIVGEKLAPEDMEEIMEEEEENTDNFVVSEGESFSEGLAAVRIYEEDGSKYAVIDKEQNVVFELPYIEDGTASYLAEEYRAIVENGSLLWQDLYEEGYLYNEKGEFIDLYEKYDSISRMGKGYYLAKKNPTGYQQAEMQYAVINNKGEEVIPFSGGLDESVEDGTMGDGVILYGNTCVSGEEGRIITVTPEYGILLAKRGECLISEGGIFDLNGNLIAEYYPDYEHRDFSIYVSDNTIVLISDYDKMQTKVYDFTGNLIAEEYMPDVTLEGVSGYSGGYCVARIDGSDGEYVAMIDEMGKFAFEPMKLSSDVLEEGTEAITSVSEGKMIYPIDETTTGCIDGTGKILFTIDLPSWRVGSCSDDCVGFLGYVGYNYVDLQKEKCLFEYDSDLVHFME